VSKLVLEPFDPEIEEPEGAAIHAPEAIGIEPLLVAAPLPVAVPLPVAAPLPVAVDKP